MESKTKNKKTREEIENMWVLSKRCLNADFHQWITHLTFRVNSLQKS
jgi:hypothetical protein